MKKILLLFLLIAHTVVAQQQTVTFTVSPMPFEEDEQITVTVTDLDPQAAWGVTDVYFWAWSFVAGDQQDAPNNGSWENSDEAQKMTKSGNSYSISFVPSTFYGRTGLTSIGFLVKAKVGTGNKKSQDHVVQVGSVEVPDVTEAPVPAGMLDGINYDPNDNSKVTLVLYAPGKQFVNLIGNFNNWQRDDTNYLLFKDTAKDRFWIELTNISPQKDVLYQYLVNGTLRIADPYSTTILDENNDQYIDNTTYPNLPSYPGETNHAVTWFRTGDPEYNWQITDFQPPAKTDLVIYELLIRDFDALHSFDAVKDRLDYLEELGINAIELMPVSEFDGNESWGYNPSFHMALDKYYGTPTAFKEFIDECHSRGMAVILDVVYNHATGQNPYYRMWNTDNGGYGGQASTDSPFFNPVATHSYSVFNDFNHSKQATKDYVKRTVQYWIDEYKIDGFRWDLTKGFTQNCTASGESCTGNYQADRVAVLKEYADYQWAADPDFYIIFEHLGGNPEETEWVEYRLNEGKGIMVWGNFNYNYSEATMGYHEGGKSDFSWIDYRERNWTVPANVSYMESHDEERLMYKNLEHGNSYGSYNIKDKGTALNRMELAGAFFFTVPGPKMIWQFGELGYDISIDFNGRTGNKPIKWEYFDEPGRKDVYELWAKLIKLKKQAPIFKTDNFSLNVGIDSLKKIHLTDDNTNPDVKYMTIIGNFGVTPQNIDPEFQQTGTWYDVLNDNSTITVSNPSALISLQPGEFKLFASSAVTLGVEDFQTDRAISVYPNPATDRFTVNRLYERIKIYDLSGRMVKEIDAKSQQAEIDVSELNAGIYLLQIKGGDGMYNGKLIKQ